MTKRAAARTPSARCSQLPQPTREGGAGGVREVALARSATALWSIEECRKFALAKSNLPWGFPHSTILGSSRRGKGSWEQAEKAKKNAAKAAGKAAEEEARKAELQAERTRVAFTTDRERLMKLFEEGVVPELPPPAKVALGRGSIVSS